MAAVGIELFGAADAQTLYELAEVLRLGVLTLDAAGKVVTANRHALKLFPVGCEFPARLAAPAAASALLEEVVSGNVSATRLESAHAGRVRRLDAVVFMLGGTGLRAVVFKDVTAALETQEDLERQRAFYRDLFGHLGVALMLFDHDRRLAWCNDVASELLLPPGAGGELTCRRALCLEAGQCAECPLPAAFRGDQVARGELEVPVTGKGRRCFHITAAPLKDYKGDVINVKVLLEDVTEERQREKQYRQKLEKEVEERTQALAEANRRLVMLDEMKDQFLANVTHELRTPLVSGIGYVELLLHGGLGHITEEAAKGLEVTHRNLMRLTDLIEDLLTYTRLQADQEEMAIEPLDLGRMIADAVADLRVRYRQQRLDVEMRVDEPLPLALADADKVHRVIVNLLDNAAKFAGEDGRIRVSASAAGGAVRLRLEDNGPGIPASEREAVFERFQRGSAAVKAGTRGAGIGLSLVKQILLAHGSSIEVSDSELGGAAFSFTLPAAGAERAGCRQRLVLVVDDDAESAALLKTVLLEAGYRVDTAASASQAIERVRSLSPDLVLLDLSLPDEDGLCLLRRLRSEPVHVLAMSAHASARRKREVRNAGALALLTKPFTIQELVRRVQEALAP